MILESAQLLWTAHHVAGPALLPGAAAAGVKIYRETHANHPTAKWVRSSRRAYAWAAELGLALCAEFTARYGKVHASEAGLRWLAANAPRFGFEMSFPAGSRQQVKWEPWHWRWVGTSATAPGAPRARFLFARARDQFPADPAVDPVRTIERVTPVVYVAVPAWIDPAPSKKKRRR